MHSSSNVRKMGNSSMYDRREIFSEEDFCDPDYHKFRLPQFSREHHETLLHSQK